MQNWRLEDSDVSTWGTGQAYVTLVYSYNDQIEAIHFTAWDGAVETRMVPDVESDTCPIDLTEATRTADSFSTSDPLVFEFSFTRSCHT